MLKGSVLLIMKPSRSNLLLLFFLTLAIFSGGGIAIFACSKAISRGGSLFVIILLALALSAAALSFLRRYYFSFHRSAQLLPAPLAAQMEELNAQERYELLCNSYAEQNERFNKLTVERLLGRLLADNSHTQAVENLGEHLQDILHSEAFGYRWTNYCLVGVQLEDYESYMLNNCDGHLLLKDLRRMYDVVNHSFDAMLNNHHRAHSVEFQNVIVFLVNLTGTTPETPRTEIENTVDILCEGCSDVVREIAEAFNLSVLVSVSTPFSNVAETHSTFEWLMTLRQYNDFVGKGKPVLGPADFGQFIQVPHNAPVAMEKAYYTALLTEDFVKAEQALYELEAYALHNNGYSISVLKNIITLCLSTAEDIATSNTLSTENVSSIDWRTKIRNCENLKELNLLIHDFFQFLIGRAEPRQHESSSTAKKIISFLDENYTCPDLSTTMLSESLSLSASYISRIFKKETGQNIPDYIHNKRVHYAKELLVSTDLSVNDISIKVGYSTAWTMNRIFKRLVHMTPGAWRQLAQSGQEEIEE